METAFRKQKEWFIDGRRESLALFVDVPIEQNRKQSLKQIRKILDRVDKGPE